MGGGWSRAGSTPRAPKKRGIGLCTRLPLRTGPPARPPPRRAGVRGGCPPKRGTGWGGLVDLPFAFWRREDRASGRGGQPSGALTPRARVRAAPLPTCSFLLSLLLFPSTHSSPVVAMVWEGKSVVTTGRKIIGATNPLASEPGTIRGDFCIDVGRNIIHGSDAVEAAQREIALWFPEGVTTYEAGMAKFVYE